MRHTEIGGYRRISEVAVCSVAVFAQEAGVIPGPFGHTVRRMPHAIRGEVGTRHCGFHRWVSGGLPSQVIGSSGEHECSCCTTGIGNVQTGQRYGVRRLLPEALQRLIDHRGGDRRPAQPSRQTRQSHGATNSSEQTDGMNYGVYLLVAEATMTRIEFTGQDVVSARVGDDILIRLDENPSTGYFWAIQITGTAVVSTGDEYVRPPDTRIGGGGQRVFTVTASAPGAANIVLRCARPGEPDPTPRVVHVTVHDD